MQKANFGNALDRTRIRRHTPYAMIVSTGKVRTKKKLRGDIEKYLV